MKTLTVAALLAAVSAVDALKLTPRQRSPAAVSFDIQKPHRPSVRSPSAGASGRRRRRASSSSDTLAVTLNNEQRSLYVANISLGTPGQQISTQIDTGSSDLWVNSASAPLCESSHRCSVSGTYDANKSSSYHYLNSDFSVSYVDNSGANGDYVRDTLHIGSATIRDFQFGVATNSSSANSVLGIGYAALLAHPYANLPQALVNAGLIKTRAYSLWLNDLYASSGQILFGGVDTDKYSGTLETVPVIPTGSQYTELAIGLTSIDISGGSGDNSRTISLKGGMAAVLDSGSTFCALPVSIVSAIYDAFDVKYDESQGAGFVNCPSGNGAWDTGVTFSFGSARVTVPLAELAIPYEYSQSISSTGKVSSRPAACIFGMLPVNDGSSAILGDTFLRSAYAVYDLDGNTISLAQTKFNVTSSHVVEISKGSSVPNAHAAASAVSSVAASATPTTMTAAPTFSAAMRTSSSGRAEPTGRPNPRLGALAGLVGAGALFAAL